MTSVHKSERLAEYPDLPEEYHHAVLNEGKIWLIGRKFVDRPHYNYGHYVSFVGAHSTFFDLRTKEWGGPSKQFQSVSNQENLAEILFVHNAQIFLLLFTQFDEFSVTTLYEFDESARDWKKFADVQTSPKDVISSIEGKQHGLRHSLLLVDGEAGSGRYFVSFVDHKIRAHLLSISAESRSAKWELVCELPDSANVMKIQPTRAILDGGKQRIFVQGGVQGCGFRYLPLALIIVDIEAKSGELVEVGSEENRPSFSFTGPEAQVFSAANNKWIHLAGRAASGMHGSVFNGEVWSIENLDTARPKWKRVQELLIPEPKSGEDLHIIVDNHLSDVFVLSRHLGIVKIAFAL